MEVYGIVADVLTVPTRSDVLTRIRGAPAARGQWKRLTAAFASLLAVSTLGFGWWLLRPEPPAPFVQLSLAFEEGQVPVGLMELTADGSALVYVGPDESGQDTQLWIRR